MAKRKRSKSRERDSNNIASSLLTRTNFTTVLSELEDRRTFHPARYKPVRGFFKDASVIGIAPVKGNVSKRKRGGNYVADVFKFNTPSAVGVCIRRKRRKEVLFALNRAGKGSRSRKRRRNENSDVSCR